MKLIEIITNNVGEDVMNQDNYLKNLGYDEDTLNDEAVLIGEFPDGDMQAQVYDVSCGGYHVSTKYEEYYTEDNPLEKDL